MPSLFIQNIPVFNYFQIFLLKYVTNSTFYAWKAAEINHSTAYCRKIQLYLQESPPLTDFSFQNWSQLVKPSVYCSIKHSMNNFPPNFSPENMSNIFPPWFLWTIFPPKYLVPVWAPFPPKYLVPVRAPFPQHILCLLGHLSPQHFLCLLGHLSPQHFLNLLGNQKIKTHNMSCDS